MGCHESDSHEPKQKDNLSSHQGGAKNSGGITKSSLIFGLILVLIAGMFLGYFFKPSAPSGDHLAMITSKSVTEQREDFIALVDNIEAEMTKQDKNDFETRHEAHLQEIIDDMYPKVQ